MSTSGGAAGGGARRLEVLRLGRTEYGATWALQRELVDKRIAGEIPDTLILTEHEPVVTLGRGASREGLAGTTVPVFEIERGGDLTWHGPGQIVAYPIFALDEERRDARRFLRDLEEVVLRVLAEVEIQGTRKDGLTGVWIGDRKVCSIGVAFRRWTSYHGLALNVWNERDSFAGLRPCGLAPETMTRVADHAEIPPSTMLFEVLLVKHFLEVFGLELPPPRAGVPGGADPGGGRFPTLPVLP